MTEVLLLLFGVLSFVFLWCGLLYASARQSGWTDLSRLYAWRSKVDGTRVFKKKREPATFTLNGKGGGRNNNAIYADHTGLYLTPTFLSKPFHPNLFIPWEEITTKVEEKEIFGFKSKSVTLTFFNAGDAYIVISDKEAMNLKEASGGAWKCELE